MAIVNLKYIESINYIKDPFSILFYKILNKYIWKCAIVLLINSIWQRAVNGDAFKYKQF